MSRGLRWTPEALTARGWRDPDQPRYEGADLSTGSPWPTGPMRGGPNAASQMAPPAAIHPRQRTRKPSKPIPYERDVLRAVLAALRAHPRVAWCTRVNSGMAMLPGRGGKLQPVRYGFEGCSDIIGQMETRVDARTNAQCYWQRGAFLACEVKRPGRKPTMAQASFLLRVREAGGVGFVATGVSDVWEHLGKP